MDKFGACWGYMETTCKPSKERCVIRTGSMELELRMEMETWESLDCSWLLKSWEWMASSQKDVCYKKRSDLGDTLRICHDQRKMVLCPNPGFLRIKVPK